MFSVNLFDGLCLFNEQYRMKQLVKKCLRVHLSHTYTRLVFVTDPSTAIQKCKVTCNLSNFKTKYFFTLTQVGFYNWNIYFYSSKFEGSNCTFT